MIEGKIIHVPRGAPGETSFELDLSNVLSIEMRQPEVATVNKETAPELMFIFNKGYSEVSRMMTKVSFEYNQALKFANKRKSVVTLEVAPTILKEKNLVNARSPAGSEDLRRAVLEQDDEYLALVDKVHIIEAFYEFLKTKQKSMEMSYYSCRKIYDGSYASLGSSIDNHTNGHYNGQ
jgi:hypothetical protein